MKFYKRIELITVSSFVTLGFVLTANNAFAQTTNTDPQPVIVDFGNSTQTTQASEPVPVPVITQRLPIDEADALQMALRAKSAGDWAELRRIMNVTNYPSIKQAIEWMLTTSVNSGASFSEQRAALDNLVGFPEMRALRAQLEKDINNYGLNVNDRIAFLTRSEPNLSAQGPISADGKLNLAKAYLEIGRTEEATTIIKDYWHTQRMDLNRQISFLNQFGAYLTPQDHDARVDFLLWAERKTQARALLSLMSPEGRRNANLRLGIQSGEETILTGSAIDDRGIKYERVHSLRAQDRNSEALDLLSTIDSRGLPEPGQEALWTERRILLLEAIRSKRWNDGYNIISQHGLSPGSKYAEAEFSSGWIALRFLNQPQTALRHFQNFDSAVATSMSKSRGYYWMARTYDALNNSNSANDYYNRAARYSTFYYGQLAASHLAQINSQTAILNLPPEQRATTTDWAQINARPMMQIAKTFAAIGERDLFVKFAFALDDTLTTNGEHQALSEFSRSRNENLVGIRVAKAGLNRGILATEAAFPIIDIPNIVGYNQAEDAFTLAITRQESEFNTNAVSRAGARGLMQFLPATANSQARKMGIPHNTAWLTSRPEHSLTLGSAHLADLTDRFYGSYVLAIISYNAGPGRASQWINTYGELRATTPEEAIDWVEMIPFSETRNYVQRVLENMQVYRARLNGDSAPLKIYDDLTRGTRPPPEFKVNIMPGADAPGGPPPETSEPSAQTTE